MKRFLVFVIAFAGLLSWPVRAQRTASNPLGAQLNVQDAGTCSTTNSFAWQTLPINAAATTVNLSGTFSGTLTIRLSNNGGGSWTTNATVTSAGTTSVATSGFTDICADVTTYTSGIFQVSITTGLNTGPQGPPGPAGGSPTVGSQTSFGNTVSPLAYSGKWDVKFVYDATYTNASTTVTCPNNDCNFTAADVGKIVIGFEGPWSSNNGTSLYASLITNQSTVLPTITAVNGAQSITISAAATQGCVATAANFNVCTLAWGTQDDTTALNNAMTAAWGTAGTCRALELPSGSAFISGPVLSLAFASMSSACGGQQGTTGGMDLNQTGPEVYGQGPNNSTLIPLPTYNFAGCTNGAGLNVCNLATGNLEAHDFAINGLANSIGGTHNVVFVSLEGSGGGAGCTGSTGFNLTFANWGILATGSTGFQAGTNACGDPMYTNNISELFGAQNCNFTTSFIMTIYANACFGSGNTSAATFNATGSSAILNSNNSFYGNSSNGNNNVNITVSGGGTFNSKGDLITTNYANGVSMIRVNSGSSLGTVNLDGDQIVMPSNTTALSYALLLQGSGGTTNVHVKGTSIVATGANNRVLLSSALNNLFDDGGNTWTNGSQLWSVAGGFIADGHSVKGTCTGVANATQATQSMYGTGPNVTGTTCAAQTATVGAGLQVQGPRTLQNLIVSSSATTVAITVTVTVNGANSTITCTMTAATSCVDTTHSVAVNDGDLVSIKYSTGAAETGANLKAIVEWQ